MVGRQDDRVFFTRTRQRQFCMLFMLDVYMFFFILLKVLKSTCALCLYLKMGEITMENLDSLFDKKLAPIRSTLEDLTTSASFLSERFDAIEQKVKDLEITADTVQKENNYLRLETLRLSKIIEEMKDNINDMEQYSRRECCEITAGFSRRAGDRRFSPCTKAYHAGYKFWIHSIFSTTF